MEKLKYVIFVYVPEERCYTEDTNQLHVVCYLQDTTVTATTVPATTVPATTVPVKLPAQCLGDGSANTGLANTRRTNEAQNRSFQTVFDLTNS